jgi:HipA-like protein
MSTSTPRKPALRDQVSRFLRAFGAGGHPPAPSDEPVELLVFVHPGAPGEARVLVGTLASQGERWSFKYDSRYATDPTAPAISAFPDKTRTYESPFLWPFFDVRLPPLEREDVREIVEREGLEEEDKLRLLGVLSRRAITSPYEFELSDVDAE